MPVGTKGTVKTVHPDELIALGTPILLGNTYHLHFRPGEDVIAELGGLHRFMGWAADPHRLRRLPGLLAARHDCAQSTTTASPSAPSTTVLPPGFTPELGAAIQAARLRHRDVSRPLPARGRAAARARGGRPPHHALGRAPARGPARRGPAPLRDRPGRLRPELRRRSIEEIAELGFDGHALGGLAIGEDRGLMFETTAWAATLLPADRPRYFMGIGDPEGDARSDRARHGHVRLRPADADCARTGSAITWEGRLNLRNARFARDPRPLDEGCPCPACTRFCRAYLRHLINQEELLGPTPAEPPQSTIPA